MSENCVLFKIVKKSSLKKQKSVDISSFGHFRLVSNYMKMRFLFQWKENRRLHVSISQNLIEIPRNPNDEEGMSVYERDRLIMCSR